MLLSGLVLSAPLTFTLARQPLETETARQPQAGSFEVQTAFEYQTSKEGTERALPFAFEYGVTDRLALTVEPVFYTAIRPKQGQRATGLGDLEITLSYLSERERGRLPALAVAGEVKAPAARNILIGTRISSEYRLHAGGRRRNRQYQPECHAGNISRRDGRDAGLPLPDAGEDILHLRGELRQ
jgi:hypothetical protein